MQDWMADILYRSFPLKQTNSERYVDDFTVSEGGSTTLFWGAYPNFFAHTAKCRSSFLVIGSTAFTFPFYGLYPSETFPGERETRDGDGVLYPSGLSSLRCAVDSS